MYGPLSERFLRSVRNSSRLYNSADIYLGTDLIAENVAIADWSVTADAGASIRRHASVTLTTPRSTLNVGTSGLRITTEESVETLVNINGADIFAVEIVLKTGFAYGNANETVPLGRYIVWGANYDFTKGDVVELELYDLSKYLDMAQILRVQDFSGTSARAAIQSLVNTAMPRSFTVVFASDVLDQILPGGATYDNTCLDAILEICDVLGAEFYFDLAGIPQVRKKRAITGATDPSESVFGLDTNSVDANIIAVSRSASRDGVFNGIGVYGAQPSGTQPQAFGEVYDLNTESRTYWNGPFGKAFKRMDRPELTTNAQCIAAAQAELNNAISGVSPCELDALQNPALEPGDLITALLPDGTTELHLIESLNMSDEGRMGVTTLGRAVKL